MIEDSIGQIIIGLLLLNFGVLGGYVLAVEIRKADQGDWSTRCGQEQRVGDRWRKLWERQRHIDDLSVAASRHEQHDIDRLARVLGHEARPDRRSEP